MSMKRLFKTLLCTAMIAAAAVTTHITAFAKDVKIDVSDAKKAGANEQSVSIDKDEFDLRRLSKRSVIKVAFETDEFDEAYPPIQMTIQSWDNDTSPNVDEKGGVWAKIAPAEFAETTAKFTYDDIVKAYGTSDLSQVNKIMIGTPEDTAPAIVKAVEITECKGELGFSDLTIDCSEAVEASQVNPSFTLNYEAFDSTRMTKDSRIIVSYTTDGDESKLTKPPVSIIMQGVDSNSPYADENGGTWLTVDPASCNDGRAIFKYQDMVEVYGTADFSKVDYLRFIPNGEASLKVETVEITDCMPEENGTHASAADDSSTAEESKPDDSSEAAAATESSDNSDKESGSSVTMVVIGIIAGVVLAIVVVFIILTKQSSQEYDIDKRRMVSKKKPKNKAKW